MPAGGKRKCQQSAAETHRALNLCEEEILGFTHCESGKMLCERWGLPRDLSEVVRCHHDVGRAETARPLVCLVHLSDLLCRLRYLGYGYDEIMGVDLSGDSAWQTLVEIHPTLADMDLARFTLDIDGAMDQIVATVDSVFGASS